MAENQKDRALEFGEYLASSATLYLEVTNDPAAHDDEKADVLRALRSAIYEFRKRRAKALT